ncbi:MAG: type II secretion system protein GspK, partial [Gammaproteobacteria bacterium]
MNAVPRYPARAPRAACRQRGFALLSAILLAALVVALAAGIGERAGYAIASTTRVLEASRADEVFTALEQAARDALRRDAVLGNSDSLEEAWAQTSLAENVVGADGDARLRDLQGLFNLNNLVADPAFGAGAGGAGADADADGTTDAGAADGSGPDGATGSDAAAGAPAASSGPAAAAAAGTPSAGNGAAAAASTSSANGNVLVARDTVQLAPGIYTDTRPRGDGSSPFADANAPAPGPGTATPAASAAASAAA